jgi:capsid portal protein
MGGVTAPNLSGVFDRVKNIFNKGAETSDQLNSAIFEPIDTTGMPDSAARQIEKIVSISKGIANYRDWAEKRGAKFKNKRQASRSRTGFYKKVIARQDEQAVYRQGEADDVDVFAGQYGQWGLLEPQYSFSKLYAIVGESEALQWCVAAMVEGCEGNGHAFDFLGDRKSEKDTDSEKLNETTLKDFFDEVNRDGSFAVARERWRTDLEATGNAAFEIARNELGEIVGLWHIPITFCRMTPPEIDSQMIDWTTRRAGKQVTMRYRYQFRKFCRYLPYQGYKATWFKELGDKRIMNKHDGSFHVNPAEVAPEDRASEIWWTKLPFKNMDYGAPRWIGALTTIKGRILANFVNYDLFNNQGIPPLLIIAAGGHFTDGTLDEVENTLESWRDPEKFNRVCLMEIEQNELGFGDSTQNKVTVLIEKLRDARAEDYMFSQFLEYSALVIGQCWRMAQLLLGSSKDYSLASAYAAQQTAEQQVFAPERRKFDEQVKLKIIRAEFHIWSWTIKSLGPQITGSDELAKIFGQITRGGGASMNDLTEFLNKYVGTTIKLSDNALMKAPANIVLALARLGRIQIDDNGDLVQLSPMEAQGAVPLEGEELPEQMTEAKPAGSAGQSPLNINGVGSVKSVKRFRKGLEHHDEYPNFLEALRDVARKAIEKQHHSATQARHKPTGRFTLKLHDARLQQWNEAHSHFSTDAILKAGQLRDGTVANDDEENVPIFESEHEIPPTEASVTGGIFGKESGDGKAS